MAVSVIIPVYTGYDVVFSCIESVLLSRTSNLLGFSIVVIYDCSGELAVEDYLHKLEKSGDIILLVNSDNLGFVKSVNKGFFHAGKDNCIILNSDTMVYGNWVDRFSAIAALDKTIGTITPFTNNGEICSFPKICVDNAIPLVTCASKIDEAFSKNSLDDLIDLPTGVGFCMYVNRKALIEVGCFDEVAFGRGYGEENDLCLRFINKGYRNVLAPNIFVFHSGGESFGDEKKDLIKKATAIIQNRYPLYAAQVAKFIAEDTPRKYRFSALISLFSLSSNPAVLMISHGMGGGTEQYIEEIVDEFSHTINFFKMSPLNRESILIEFPSWCDVKPLVFNMVDDYEVLKELFVFLKIGTAHVSHIKGYEKFVMSFLLDMAIPHILTIHDYYLISGNPTLTGDNGLYAPHIADSIVSRADDIKKNVDFCSVNDWLSIADFYINHAKNIIFPSTRICDVFSRVYPSIRSVIAGHLDSEKFGQYPDVIVNQDKDCAHLKVAVLGAVSKEKGADLLDEVAKLSEKKGLAIKFFLVGYAYRPLSPCIITTGPYQRTMLKAMLVDLNPHLVWFPSLCAESYSYTLSSAFESGLPVMVPRIGAQYERTINRPCTVVFDSLEPEYLLELMQKFFSDMRGMLKPSVPWAQVKNSRFSYLDNYFALIDKKIKYTAEPMQFDKLKALLAREFMGDELQIRSRVLRLLIRIRLNRYFSWAVNWIPISLQKKIKNRLHRGSLHDI
jgi:GT2 family glycosyltransferase/glycosyltransferase involved in cell wall biosynthesis